MSDDTPKKILLIVCYYGKLPWYFRYFIHSCKYNATIDFLIITDDTTYKRPIPDNVRFVYKTLKDLSSLVCAKMGFEVAILYGYKLCDFKPAY